MYKRFNTMLAKYIESQMTEIDYKNDKEMQTFKRNFYEYF